MKAKIDKVRVTILLLLFGLHINIYAVYNTTVKSSDSDVTAVSEFKKTMAEGGTIAFEAGEWNINISSNQMIPQGEVTIIGANEVDTENPDYKGAYEDISRVKTTLTFGSAGLKITKACPRISIRNVKLLQAGITVDNDCQPEINMSNVIYDISTWNKTAWVKTHILANNGFGGTMEHVSFYGYASASIRVNRNRPTEAQRPISKVNKIVIDYCKFKALDSNKESGSVYFDAGNDEYSGTLNLSGTEIKNSHFVNAALSTSKISNLNVYNNLFEMYDGASNILHFEEYSHDILFDNNTITVTDGYTGSMMYLGVKQPTYNFTITNNTIIQSPNGSIKRFASGKCIKNLIFTGNTLLNPNPATEYLQLGDCGNENLTYENNSGFGTLSESGPCSSILNNNQYYITYGNGKYLGIVEGEVRVIELSNAPTDDAFLWEVEFERMVYYTIKNKATGNYLEVLYGPTANHLVPAGSDIAQYQPEGVPVYARCFDNYNDIDRKPVWEIYNQNGGYCMLLGGNESRSDIRLFEESKVSVFHFRDQKYKLYADYNWNFVPATEKDTAIDNEVNNNTNKIKVYPNPANNSIKIDGIRNQMVHITDLTGNILISQQIIDPSESIDLSSLSEGMYFVISNNQISKLLIQ